MKVAVYMQTHAFYTAEIELHATDLAQLADDYGITVDKLTPEHIRELAEMKAFDKGKPWLCHQEVITLGDDWETPEATEHAVSIVER